MKVFSLFFLSFAVCLFSEVGVQTREFYDDERERPVTLEIWYPIEQGIFEKVEDTTEWGAVWLEIDERRDADLKIADEPYPLLMMSHGNWGDRRDRSWFGAAMAEKGYIVASVEHHGNTWKYDDPEFFLTPWQRPMDVQFAITEVLNDEYFGPFINENKIALNGYSIGGHAGVWLAGARLENLKKGTLELTNVELPRIVLQRLLEKCDFEKCTESFYDPRIKAYLLMAPAMWGFLPETLSNIKAPMHLIYAEGDRVLPPMTNAEYLMGEVPSITAFKIPGKCDHYVFLNRASLYGMTKLPHFVYEDDISVDREKIHEDILEYAEQFLSDHL